MCKITEKISIEKRKEFLKSCECHSPKDIHIRENLWIINIIEFKLNYRLLKKQLYNVYYLNEKE